MTKLSKSREKFLLEKYFSTKNKKNIPTHLSQFGYRDSELTDEDLFFITQYVTHIDRVAIGGSWITESGLQYLKKLKDTKYLDLRSMSLNDDNLDCILHLENLEYLYIKFTDVTARGIAKILQSFPKLQTLIAEIPESERDFAELLEKQYPEMELIINLRREPPF